MRVYPLAIFATFSLTTYLYYTVLPPSSPSLLCRRRAASCWRSRVQYANPLLNQSLKLALETPIHDIDGLNDLQVSLNHLHTINSSETQTYLSRATKLTAHPY